MKKNDFILISIILTVALVSIFAINFTKQDGDYVIVRIDGVEVATYNLSEDGEYELNSGTNILRIENGKAYLIYADCPDHLCVKQGKIDQGGETITCLPNKLTITVYSKSSSEVEIVG